MLGLGILCVLSVTLFLFQFYRGARTSSGDCRMRWFGFLGQTKNVKRRLRPWSWVRIGGRVGGAVSWEAIGREQSSRDFPCGRSKVQHMHYSSCFAPLLSGTLNISPRLLQVSARAFYHRACAASVPHHPFPPLAVTAASPASHLFLPWSSSAPSEPPLLMAVLGSSH